MPAIVAVFVILDGHLDALTADEVLADPARMLSSAERMNFVGTNAFNVETGPTGACLRSTPRHSASALYGPVMRQPRC
jgi:hypothetical protein